MKQVVIFARSCKNIQDCDRQVNQLKDLAISKGWEVDAVFREIGSGTKRIRDRKELIRMIEYLHTHHINKVLVTEPNRLGRDCSQTLGVLVQLHKLGVSLYNLNDDIDTLTENSVRASSAETLENKCPVWHKVILHHCVNTKLL